MAGTQGSAASTDRVKKKAVQCNFKKKILSSGQRVGNHEGKGEMSAAPTTWATLKAGPAAITWPPPPPQQAQEPPVPAAAFGFGSAAIGCQTETSKSAPVASLVPTSKATISPSSDRRSRRVEAPSPSSSSSSSSA